MAAAEGQKLCCEVGPGEGLTLEGPIRTAKMPVVLCLESKRGKSLYIQCFWMRKQTSSAAALRCISRNVRIYHTGDVPVHKPPGVHYQSFVSRTSRRVSFQMPCIGSSADLPLQNRHVLCAQIQDGIRRFKHRRSQKQKLNKCSLPCKL